MRVEGVLNCRSISDWESWQGKPASCARLDSRGRLSPHDHTQRPLSEITRTCFILRPTHNPGPLRAGSIPRRWHAHTGEAPTYDQCRMLQNAACHRTGDGEAAGDRSCGAAGFESALKLSFNSRLGKLARKAWRAALAWTAEGGCPHMIIGPHQVTIAIFNCLPTLNGNRIGRTAALCVK